MSRTKDYQRAYPINRARASAEADSRENWNLAKSAVRAGLENVEAQWEGIAETGQLFHFDVTGTYRGHRFLFDLSLDYRDDNAPAKRTVDVLERKKEWAAANNHTHAVIYRHGGMNDFRLGIKRAVAEWLVANDLLGGSGWL